MENNSIFHSQNKEQSMSEDSLVESKQIASSSPTNESSLMSGKTIKRENDSVDDFEHLEHEISPNDESRAGIKNVLDVTSMQLIDLPLSPKKEKRSDARVEELTNLASKLERNILDTSIPADEKILQPVPATPPPSANYEKYAQPERESDEDEDDTTSQVLVESAQTLSGIVGQNCDPNDQHYPDDYNNQLTSRTIKEDYKNTSEMDSKAATMAFMETEKASSDYHESEPLNIHAKMDHEVKPLTGLENREKHVFVDEKSQRGGFRDNFKVKSKDTTNFFITGITPAAFIKKFAVESSRNTTKDQSVLQKNSNFDDQESDHDDKHEEPLSFQKSNEFLSNIESSVLPVAEKSPEYDFLAGETSPNIEIKNIPHETKNLMEDDTWNVVERPETKTHPVSGAQKEVESGDAFKAQKDYYDEAPTKPLPPLPKNDNDDDETEPFATRNEYERECLHDETFEMSNDFISSAAANKSKGQQQHSGAETGDSEFESAPEQSPAKTSARPNTNETNTYYSGRKVNADDIAPKAIFTDMGLGKYDDSYTTSCLSFLYS